MKNKIFIDTNIWVYLILQDDYEKYRMIKDFLHNNSNSCFIITYQVINEVSNTLRKYKYSEAEIRNYIEILYQTCTIQDFSKEIILNASFLRDRYSVSFWDSILVSSALFSASNLLISEDMQNGLIVEKRLIIKNIFI